MKALFTASIFKDEHIKLLHDMGLELTCARGDLSEQELIDMLGDYEVYILGGHEKATAKIVNSPKLKLICFLGTGYESHVDVKSANARGIPVTYTPNANAYTVAEFTAGLILAVVKNIPFLSTKTKQGAWGNYVLPLLTGKNLGIVGMGAIGSKVARIMKNGFGMNILYTSLSQKPELELELGAKKLDLDELIKLSDVASLHVKTTEKTKGMIGEQELALFKPNSYLVNTARAEIVDGKALYNALVSGKLARAGFDVYYSEPVPSLENDPYGLMSLGDDKFILSPHTAYSSSEAESEMAKMLMDSITDFLEGRSLRHLVPASEG